MDAPYTPRSTAPHQFAARLVDDALAIANTWRIHGRWTDALTLLRGLQPVVSEVGDAAVARQLLSIARVLTDMASFGGFETLEERELALRQALAHAESTGDAPLIGDVSDAQGMSLHITYLEGDRANEPAEELPSFERGLSFRQQAGAPAAVAESLFHIGLVYGVVRRDHERAMPYFKEAYRLASEAQDAIVASYAIRHVAFAHAATGDIPAARAALEESLRLREGADFIPGVAMALMVLAYGSEQAGDTAQARQHLERAKGIFESLGAARRVAEVDQELLRLHQLTSP